jgi:hypothetical protein
MRWLWMVVLAGCGLWEVPEVPVVPPMDTVAVQVVRFDTGGLVSTGVPLAPGLLRDADSVRLMIDGAEVPMYVEPLAGRHADGSYRSMLVQFPWAGDSARGVLEFGVAGVRQGTKTPITWTLESAVILPTSPQYIVATEVLPRTIPSSELPATALNLAYDQVYRVQSARFASSGNNFYDRVYNGYAQWARTGEIEYWRRSTWLARVYAAPAPINQPHNFDPDGLFTNYLLTGDERSRKYLIDWAKARVGWWAPAKAYDWSFGLYREGRQQQRVMLSALYAGLLEDTTNAWMTLADAYVKAWVDTQEPHWAQQYDGLKLDGSWHYPLGSAGNGQSNFMEGLRVSSMITYLEYRTPAPDIQHAVEQSIRRQVDYLWNTEWNAAALSFKYWSTELRNAPFPAVPTQEMLNMRELNNLMVLGFAFTYHVTGDPKYRDQALQIMSVAYTPPAGWSPWWSGFNGKVLNQNYYSSWRALYYLHVPPRLEP